MVVEAVNHAVSRGCTVWVINQLRKELQGANFGLQSNGSLREPLRSDPEGSMSIGTAMDACLSIYRENQPDGTSKMYISSVKASF